MEKYGVVGDDPMEKTAAAKSKKKAEDFVKTAEPKKAKEKRDGAKEEG